MVRSVWGAAAIVLATLLSLPGCQTVSGGAGTSSAATASPAAPRYNLAGYSAAFKSGYSDACANPRRRSAERFKTDNDYSMGWQEGVSACRSR